MPSFRFRPLRLLAAFALGLTVTACGEPKPPNIEGLEALASCEYTNIFSDSPECKEYLGEDWDIDGAKSECAAQEDSTFAEGACPYEQNAGACVVGSGSGTVTQILFPTDTAYTCESSERGCEVFGGGQFIANGTCDGTPDQDLQQGLVFINPENVCVEPLNGEAGNGPDGDVCTWNQIGGCTEEGRQFQDYGQCDDVRSQRGYYPVPEDTFETASDDPILSDAAFRAEVNWVKEQVDACGCVCCHTQRETPDGGSNWVIDSDKEIWTDGFYPSGLAIGAGWIDSSLLGAYPAETNNGFGRDISGLPSTDQARMKTFFEGELARRGYVESDFADYDPIPGVFYQQQIYEPGRCENGEGVGRDDVVIWIGGDARYVYVLEADAANPLVPPNLDTPEGTLWLLEVYWDEDPMKPGLMYPEGPARAEQRYVGPPLVEATDYLLYVQADAGVPVTRCIFTY